MKPYQRAIARSFSCYFSLLALLLGLTPVVKAENPAHLRRFLATKVCIKCDLKRADLTGAKLAGAMLRKTKLTHAKLAGADLRFVDLTGANLKKADLTHADLSGAILKDANLEGAILLGTKLPVGNLFKHLKAAPLQKPQQPRPRVLP